MRKWLLRLILSKEERRVLRNAMNQALDEWQECVEDPAMHRAKEDIEVAFAVQKDIWTLERVEF